MRLFHVTQMRFIPKGEKLKEILVIAQALKRICITEIAET